MEIETIIAVHHHCLCYVVSDLFMYNVHQDIHKRRHCLLISFFFGENDKNYMSAILITFIHLILILNFDPIKNYTVEL